MKIIIIIIISFLVVGMYAFRNTMLNVHDIAPDDVGLNSYGEDFYNLTAKSIDGEIINFSQYKGICESQLSVCYLVCCVISVCHLELRLILLA